MGLDREAGGLPFGKAIFEADGREAAGVEGSDGIDGEHAVGAATVGHDRFATAQGFEALFEFGERDRERTRDVPGAIFRLGAHIEQDNFTGGHARKQFLASQRGEVITGPDQVDGDLVKFGELAAIIREELAAPLAVGAAAARRGDVTCH